MGPRGSGDEGTAVTHFSSRFYLGTSGRFRTGTQSRVQSPNPPSTASTTPDPLADLRSGWSPGHGSGCFESNSTSVLKVPPLASRTTRSDDLPVECRWYVQASTVAETSSKIYQG